MKNEVEREVDDADGAMTGATGSLTPTSSDEEFVPAERRQIEVAPPHLDEGEGETEEIPDD